MGKTTKAERQAFDALEDVAGAAKIAKKVAKDLSGKQAKKLRAAASDAFDVADTSKKAVRKHPKRVRKEAEKATDAVLAATDKALRKVEIARAEAAEAKAVKRAKAAAKRSRDAEVTVEVVSVDVITVDDVDAELDQLVAGLEMVDESELEAIEVVVEEVLDEAGVVDEGAEPVGIGVEGDATDAGDIEVELAALTVVVLRARARDAGYSGYSRLTKAQLIELLS
ncbi:hypothetical protein [Microbacterium candidum]|uniref:Rho termination factor N-terminal domain-containing protein n=1 Tax=Microbacterium candidum TaxID=3041922 RepID=A0ABT7N2W8_9MICO|nr:hypothetical protein [Microbacterium sp. ASV49]MDL9981055.1 hypothetical protein [Microbacterium sp. ASV49]